MIERTLERVTAYLRSMHARYDWEIVAVNDGSSDRTGALIDAFAANEPRVTVLHHRVNTNLGKTLRDAFAVARGDVVVTLDCDLSYGPDHIGRLVDAMVEHDADIVIASPYIDGGHLIRVPKTRELLSRGANRLLTLSAKGRLTTVTGMVRAYRRGFLQSLNLKSLDFEVNTEIIYKAQLLRARIVEIPAHLDWSEQRELGDSRKSSIRVARSVASQAFSSFLFKPFAFFIVPGLVVFALAVYSLGWAAYHTFEAWTGSGGTTFSDAVATSYQLSPHSFVVGGVCLLVGIQLVSLGVLSAQNKRYFEELFHLGTAVHSVDREVRVHVWDGVPSNVMPRRAARTMPEEPVGEPVEEFSGRAPNAVPSEG